MTSIETATPRIDMLYYPIPAPLNGCHRIYAIMDPADNQSTIMFGVDSNDPSWVYMSFQASTDRSIFYKCRDEWNHCIEPRDGCVRHAAHQARALWDDLVSRKWHVIPNQG